jgi:hypothetical protein
VRPIKENILKCINSDPIPSSLDKRATQLYAKNEGDVMRFELKKNLSCSSQDLNEE